MKNDHLRRPAEKMRRSGIMPAEMCRLTPGLRRRDLRRWWGAFWWR
jgi:hypothetical protein